jgi:uncharacterized protein (DUF1697 family)
MTTYAALLRAINVAGNKMLMPQLRELLESLGYTNVQTYIQSGNAVFTTSAGARAAELAIEKAIATEFKQVITVVLRAAKDMDAIVTRNPFLTRKKVDVKDLHATLLATKPARAKVSALELPGTADELIVDGQTVYVHTPGGYGRTKLNNTFVERRLGVRATTRNWNTMVKMRELTAAKSR